MMILWAALFSLCAAGVSNLVDVWPYPQRVTVADNGRCLSFSRVGTLQVSVSLSNSSVLSGGVARFLERLNSDASLVPFKDNIWAAQGGLVWPPQPTASSTSDRVLSKLNVVVEQDETARPLQIDVDARYQIDVGNGSIVVTSSTVWGALHALETLAQLIVWTGPDAGNVVCGVPLSISDWPRFAWRGLLVDSARHFLPVATLLEIIEGLALVKMNVLHWHLTDAESFPFHSRLHPNLTLGAYSSKAIYMPEDVEQVLRFGSRFGVVVVPEIDVPSHAASWGAGMPNITADCWPWLKARAGGNALQWPAWDNVALDVSRNETLNVVFDVFTDLAAGFGDSRFFHLGGDEVNGRCWASVPAIRAWMTANNFSQPDTNSSAPLPRGFVRNPLPNNDSLVFNTGAVQMQFEGRLEAFVGSQLGRTAVLWEEAFYPEFANSAADHLSRSAIVHVWTDASSLAKAIAVNRTVLSSIDWYLDRVDPICDGPNCTIGYAYVQTWKEMYNIDPVDLSVQEGANRADAERLIMGGEAASWGESVDEVNAVTRAFTRGVAIAERLWSSAKTNDSSLATPRLNSWRCKALRAGVRAGSTFPGYCDVSAPAIQPTSAPATAAPVPEHTCSRHNGTVDTADAVRIGTIVMGTVGGLMVILLCLSLLFVCRNRRKTKSGAIGEPKFERLE